MTYPAGPLTYGTEVQLNCSVAGGETSVRTRTCLYNVTVGKYQLIGDSLECGGKCRVGWGLRQGINVEVSVG